MRGRGDVDVGVRDVVVVVVVVAVMRLELGSWRRKVRLAAAREDLARRLVDEVDDSEEDDDEDEGSNVLDVLDEAAV